MKPHDDNVDKVITAAQRGLQKQIDKAKETGEIPKEAKVLIETSALVIWGDGLAHDRGKRIWLKQIQPRMEAKRFIDLKNQGRAYGVELLQNQKDLVVERHELHEMVDVTMIPATRQRLLDELKQKEQTDESDNPDGKARE